MTITLTKTLDTKRTEFWLLAHNNQLHHVATHKHPKRRGIDNLRYVICKTLKIDADTFRFIGNRRVDGKWVTEWMIV